MKLKTSRSFRYLRKYVPIYVLLLQTLAYIFNEEVAPCHLKKPLKKGQFARIFHFHSEQLPQVRKLNGKGEEMVQYYWNPGMGVMPQAQQMTPPQIPAANRGREESYIENILRLNRGKIGTFHFSFENAMSKSGSNVVNIRGYVEAAGRDHVIIREAATDKRFLMPMIYFNFAEFDEELYYFNQGPRAGAQTGQ
ncbi:spore coat protein GerQ [Chungangia koreensis]|uniref:Spore coat protein GerQ n=1 Tax=Chungangia koreensis TaxID=752657 RepID=A0ABV8X6G5_9LACT